MQRFFTTIAQIGRMDACARHLSHLTDTDLRLYGGRSTIMADWGLEPNATAFVRRVPGYVGMNTVFIVVYRAEIEYRATVRG